MVCAVAHLHRGRPRSSTRCRRRRSSNTVLCCVADARTNTPRQSWSFGAAPEVVPDPDPCCTGGPRPSRSRRGGENVWSESACLRGDIKRKQLGVQVGGLVFYVNGNGEKNCKSARNRLLKLFRRVIIIMESLTHLGSLQCCLLPSDEIQISTEPQFATHT